MCGICGIYSFQSVEEVKEDTIISMRDQMVHRGPDGGGVWISPDRKIGFGHRRLSIIDLSDAGHQPMANEDGQIWITYNGEIYNHNNLRPYLQQKGHVYRSHCDTETIIHHYEEKGIDCIQDFEGMFAFSIWDNRKKRMYLVRDRLGVKPLYYTFTGGQLIFASEIKSILEHPSVRRDINEEAFYHYLTFVTTPSPMTLFAGIEKLEPGHYIEVFPDGSHKKVRYWNALVQTNTNTSEDFYIENIRSLLGEAVEKRMMSDVPFGVFLSGGVDSSTNVALMDRIMNRPVDTFTVGFRNEEKYNELEYARQIAKEFNTNHHEIMIDQKDLIDFLPSLIFHQDEPIADPVCVPLYYVSKLVKDSGTTVVQVGEGADEIFCGYTNYMMFLELYWDKWRHVEKIPKFLKVPGYHLGKAMLGLMGKGRFNDFLRRAAYDEEVFWGGAIGFYELEKQSLLSDEFNQRTKEWTSFNVVDHYFDEIKAYKNPDQLEKMTYLELKLRLSELLLMRVDKITMATSVEARVPFLDHKLVEFALSIPTDIKIKDRFPKYILKKAVEGIIPDNIIYRKKMGFGAPIHEWLLGQLGDYMEDRIFNSELRERNLLNYDFIAMKLKEQKSGKANNSFQLWNLLNLTLWYDYWISGKKVF